ncbi:MAG: RNA polymerase sigma factor [Planctomycetota bacterium]
MLNRALQPDRDHRHPGSAPAEQVLPRGLPDDVLSMATAAAVSDGELVRRTLDGENDAFAALVARYQKRAFWVAFHVVGRVEDARDVTQEAFVRLYRSLGKYDYGRSFYTWFYRIVMNLAIDQLRKHKTGYAQSLDDLLSVGGMADERATDGGTIAAELAEQNGRVWQVLGKLDSKFRAVLVLRDIHGLSCREIAPILRITHATARWRLHRGRQIFKEHWERLGSAGSESS